MSLNAILAESSKASSSSAPHEYLEDGDLNPNDPLDLRDDEGWDDIEEDQETLNFRSLFENKEFGSLKDVLEFDKEHYGFDLAGLKSQLGLDFLGTAKVVNYVRAEAAHGNKQIDVIPEEILLEDRFLQPTLEDDALLFSIDELDQFAGTSSKTGSGSKRDEDVQDRVKSLEAQLKEAMETIAALRTSSTKFLENDDEKDTPLSSMRHLNVPSRLHQQSVNDDHYFDSYGFKDIHETMLKDTIRTNAYRDFIYEHKNLFQGKVVMDVGCGTGILSMMCAKAGAKHVYAIDNSSIINKARANIFENKLDGKITCLHGKVEEINMPVQKVDIIVSEWMGYALLYEAMLDSVIYARDKYLQPDGLMVPSHTSMLIAPFADSDLVTDNIAFWDDVYGFKMSAMREGMHDEVRIFHLDSKSVIAEPQVFKMLDLHRVSKADLVFTAKTTSRLAFKQDKDSIDGFVIWFDTFLCTNRDMTIPLDARAENWKKDVAFTTGPFGGRTHWCQAVLMIDEQGGRSQEDDGSSSLKDGEEVQCSVRYGRPDDNDRQLDIEIGWTVQNKQRSQRWKLL